MKKRWICLLVLPMLLLGGIALSDESGLSTGRIIDGPVSVYDGSWNNANVIGTLKTDDAVVVLQYSGWMTQVFSRVNQLAGWVPTANVRINQATPFVYPGIVISQNASLRETPSTAAKQLASLSNGTVFDILSEENDWYHARYWDEKTGAPLEGYVRTYFIVRDPMFVTTTKLTFVYAMPSRGSKMVGQLVAGTQLVVIGEFNDYWVVNLRSASGFILKSDIEYDQITGNG